MSNQVQPSNEEMELVRQLFDESLCCSYRSDVRELMANNGSNFLQILRNYIRTNVTVDNLVVLELFRKRR